MSKKAKIPIHRMDDWNAGIYLKSFSAASSARPSYDLSVTHRHDFYYGVLLEKGGMEVEVDFQHFRLGERMLFFTYPGQIHRVAKADMERGWFFAFDPAIIDQQIKDILDQNLANVMITELNEAQSTKYFTALQDLKAIYDDPGQRFSRQVLHALLAAFLYQMAGTCFSNEKDIFTGQSLRSIEITKNFRQLVRQSYRTEKRPSAYAGLLNITTSHLNDTVRSVTGFPVTYYIQQEAIREAQRMLYNSTLPIKAIALYLGFDDAQYFSKLFSKVVGIPPIKWRALYQ